MSRIIVAMENMAEPEQKAFADYVDRIKPRIYKSPDREKRKELWRKAETVLQFYERFCDIAHPGYRAFEYGVEDAAPFAQFENLDCWLDLCSKKQAAIGLLLLTPAPTVAALNRKKALRSSPRMYHVKVDLAAVDRLIGEDEAWLRANRPGRRSAVQS
jgi:hypothetical protein